MTREELEQIVIQYLDSFTTMTLACCTETKPWAAGVFYARQRFDLIFFHLPPLVTPHSFRLILP